MFDLGTGVFIDFDTDDEWSSTYLQRMYLGHKGIIVRQYTEEQKEKSRSDSSSYKKVFIPVNHFLVLIYENGKPTSKTVWFRSKHLNYISVYDVDKNLTDEKIQSLIKKYN